MFAYIKGKKTYLTPTDAYIETSSGVAYHIHISLNTYSAIEHQEDVKIYVYMHVKEDAQTLYGFVSQREKDIFIKLISVSGIGPNTARVIVSSMEVKEIINAIANDDFVRFSKVKGIGPKTAKRIILDLKDKMSKEILENDALLPTQDNSGRDEALSALVTLGFPKNKVEKLLDQVQKEADVETNSEWLIKAVLKKLS